LTDPADPTWPFHVCFAPDTVAKVENSGLKIFGENTKQRAIADTYDLNRVTEVACRFCVITSCTPKSRLRPAEFWSSAKNDFCNSIPLKAELWPAITGKSALRWAPSL
jgi:hypothetical protein